MVKTQGNINNTNTYFLLNFSYINWPLTEKKDYMAILQRKGITHSLNFGYKQMANYEVINIYILGTIGFLFWTSDSKSVSTYKNIYNDNYYAVTDSDTRNNKYLTASLGLGLEFRLSKFFCLDANMAYNYVVFNRSFNCINLGINYLVW